MFSLQITTVPDAMYPILVRNSIYPFVITSYSIHYTKLYDGKAVVCKTTIHQFKSGCRLHSLKNGFVFLLSGNNSVVECSYNFV